MSHREKLPDNLKSRTFGLRLDPKKEIDAEIINWIEERGGLKQAVIPLILDMMGRQDIMDVPKPIVDALEANARRIIVHTEDVLRQFMDEIASGSMVLVSRQDGDYDSYEASGDEMEYASSVSTWMNGGD